MSRPRNIPSELELAREAVGSATQLLRRHSTRNLRAREKSAGEYVTSLDWMIEREISRRVSENFPDDSIAGEEFGIQQGISRRVWYIDPIDGTRNLIAGRTDIAISVALYSEDSPLASVLSLPFREHEIIAFEHGLQPYYIDNERSFRWQEDYGLESALIGLPGDFRNREYKTNIIQLVTLLASETGGIRITGALGFDLGLILLGELDARITFHSKVVDVAAGAHMIRRAGGVVVDRQGYDWTPTRHDGFCLASRSLRVAEGLLELLGEDV